MMIHPVSGPPRGPNFKMNESLLPQGASQ